MVLSHLIDQLEALEPRLRTVDRLLAHGKLINNDGILDGGDFQETIWSHSWDGLFTVGCMERVRHRGESFPVHAHRQKQWMMCSLGSLAVSMDGGEPRVIKEGEYLVIEPDTPHEVIPVSEACVVVFTTIPADEGLCHDTAPKRIEQ